MQRALIVGASGGIGHALASAFDARNVICLSRSRDGLDITDEAQVDRALSKLDGTFDCIIVALGILAPKGARPEKSLKAIKADTMAEVMAVNAIGPALVLRHAPRLLPRSERSVFAVLSARVGSLEDNLLGGWYSYRASKAATNQIVRTAAIEIARSHREAIIVALHPGTVDTNLTRNYPESPKVSADDAAQNLMRVMDNLTPDQTGRFFNWAGKSVPW